MDCASGVVFHTTTDLDVGTTTLTNTVLSSSTNTGATTLVSIQPNSATDLFEAGISLTIGTSAPISANNVLSVSRATGCSTGSVPSSCDGVDIPFASTS